jgi:hypothetical protein
MRAETGDVVCAESSAKIATTGVVLRFLEFQCRWNQCSLRKLLYDIPSLDVKRKRKILSNGIQNENELLPCLMDNVLTELWILSISISVNGSSAWITFRNSTTSEQSIFEVSNSAHFTFALFITLGMPFQLPLGAPQLTAIPTCWTSILISTNP